jgi:APA family basic amino acid/polyamine antiporter
MAIGIAAMLGAGVFYVWGPAVALAGSWVLVSLLIAAMVATLNGLVTAQLAIRLPVSGGIYSYANHYRGPYAGFLAGWLFVTGKTGSAAAIAFIAASYLDVANARLIAAGFVVALSAIIISGIRLAAGVSMAIAGVVIVGLLWLTLPRTLTTAALPAFDADPSIGGIVSAAGLIFFAFAGYARMATLGEEVTNPTKTIPRAIIGALWVVFVVYLVVALAATPILMVTPSPLDTPLTVLAGTGNGWLVSALAVLASLGSLLAILAGLSRTSLAMGRRRDFPSLLARVSPRTGGPMVAEVTVAGLAVVLILVTDPLWLVGLSSAGVLTYYALGHVSALAQPKAETFLLRLVPVVGLLLCTLLVFTLPIASVTAAAVSAAIGTVWFLVNPARRAERRRRQVS